MYRHVDTHGEIIELPISKVVCVGRNYQDHVREMDKVFKSTPSDESDELLLFMKPANSLRPLEQPIIIPEHLGECHNEIEIAVLLQTNLVNCDSREQAEQAIWGIGLGLDLTLRDLQLKLKKAGQPWERAKAFDGSCPVTSFVPKSQFSDLEDIKFSLKVNGQLRQQGTSKQMIVNIADILMQSSHAFTLNAGDIIMTGTPSGVGPLASGDNLEIQLDNVIHTATEVISR